MSLKSTLVFALIALSSLVNAANFKRVACPDGKNTASNAACCAFFSLRDDLLANHFNDGCTEEVHESLRLAFHDAIGFSPALTAQGTFAGTGADGSFILFPNVEPNYAANNGTDAPVDDLTPFFHKHNVSAGDLIQFAAAVGLTQCPGGPQLEFLSGRKNAKRPAPEGLIPLPSQSVNDILKRFDDAGNFTADEVVALLASHSIARADHVDPSLNATPFDTTPFTFDTQFFLETLLIGTGVPGTKGNDGEVKSPLPQGKGDDVGELRLQSDFALARDPRTACTWQGFINHQDKMTNQFRAAMAKLAIIGSKRANLIDCTEVLPPAGRAIKKPATYPATKSQADIQQACSSPFPTLSSDAGKATDIPHCPNGETSCDGAGS